ncbi:MAG TPA: hypothetical protein VMV15_02135 [Candidatus Binataceae bacterium]|nr:hypothetical protein [Candidatus Binataceae bacterium]
MALVIALGIALGGCSHQAKTPQQQFLEALKRGNSAQASQIWLQMGPEERVKFERGQGLQPAQSPKQMKQEVMRRAMEESADDGSDAQSSTTPATGGSLGDLPRYLNSPQAGGGASP